MHVRGHLKADLIKSLMGLTVAVLVIKNLTFQIKCLVREELGCIENGLPPGMSSVQTEWLVCLRASRTLGAISRSVLATRLCFGKPFGIKFYHCLVMPASKAPNSRESHIYISFGFFFTYSIQSFIQQIFTMRMVCIRHHESDCRGSSETPSE